MKVQVSMTLEFNAKDLKSYMADLGCENETVADYVRSYAISAIPEMLSENLRDNGYQSTVDVTKSNYQGASVMETKRCGGCGTTDLKMFTESQRNKCKDCRKLEKVKGEAENTPTNWLSKAW